MNTTSPATVTFLRREHERARATLLVWSAAAVLVASATSGAGRLGWLAHGEEWALVPGAVSAALLIWWLRRARRLTRAAFARQLDEHFDLSARLEAAVELSHDDSKFAAAQRTDAAYRFSNRGSTGLAGWFAGIAVIIVLLSLLAVEGAVFTVRIFRTPPLAEVKPPAATPVEVRASIDWETPEREIKATAIEEVPLKALAESGKGFHAVSLEVSVNGEHRLSRPLDTAALGEAAKPGSHQLTPSLYLDEAAAKPYDIISYYLTGDLNDSKPVRVVTSPLQFIQIRASRQDVGQTGTANPKLLKMLSLLNSLKLGQLRLIELNFGLSHMSGAKNDPAWKTENARLASEQKNLEAKAVEARIYALSIGAPFLIAINLTEAGLLMDEASKDIASTLNDEASKPQGRALALITECEKLFNRALSVKGRVPPLPMEDPFRDDQVFKLPTREETPAGELEKLAARQREANRQLSSAEAKDGSSGGGDAPAENGIARDAEKLAAGGELDPSARALTREAGNAAATAARQLGADDLQAAREPAASAQASLEKAVEAQDKAGRQVASAELEQIRREINGASRTDNAADRGAKLAAAREALREAAVQQQRSGSSEAARQLAALSQAIGRSKSAANPSAPNSTERAREVATAAARTQIALAPRAAAFTRAIRLLGRARQAIEGAADQPREGLGDLEIASQEAEWLASDAPTVELARKLAAQAAGLQSGKGGKPALHEAAEGAQRLANALETGLSIGQRDEILRRFNVDEVDPVYREAVETYFERLSREGAKAQPTPARP